MSVLSRRALLLSGAAAAAAAPDPAIRREVFFASPRKGVALMVMAWYTRRTGGEMMSIEERWSRSDTIDVAYCRRSRDFGKTWSAPVERKTGERTPQGMLRRHLRGGWVDPHTGRHLEFWNEGVLPSDDPLEGLRQWRIYYTVDGAPTPRLVRQRGPQFSDDRPLPGIERGKTSIMMGDHTCQPLALADGSILLPASLTRLGPDGKVYNPTGAYTYHDSAVIIGRWRGRDLDWELSAPVQGDPARATRGMDEPTLAQIAGGRVLMVLRGSNDKRYELPSHRWYSISHDGGRHWTPPEPWTYAGGEPFFSPSACSQLVPHSNGKLYWLGNITPGNPRGNRPRYPFVIGEVDRGSGLLRRETVRVVDDLAPGEDPLLTLSNFYAREDRPTRGIALHMSRLFAKADGWEGDSFLYRIPA